MRVMRTIIGGHFYRLLYIVACGNSEFMLYLLFLAFDTLVPAPSLM
jgi:hypothetical protein